jgi:hypothetical protein
MSSNQYFTHGLQKRFQIASVWIDTTRHLPAPTQAATNSTINTSVPTAVDPTLGKDPALSREFGEPLIWNTGFGGDPATG